MKLGIENESYHLLFQNKRMDVFSFIEKAAELGLDGVQINLVPDYNLDQKWGALGGNSPEHLKKIKELVDRHNLYIELDTRNLEVAHLKEVIEIAHTLGAEVIRTYIPVKSKQIVEGKSGAQGGYDFAKVRQIFDTSIYEESLENLRSLVPHLERYRIKLALENHEYETSDELLKVIKAIDSKWIGFTFDAGNSMMAWEDPIKAAKNMAPYTFTTHFKDHIVVEEKGDIYGNVVCGVPLGEGNLELEKIYEILFKDSSLTRINLESCHPYCAQFKREPGTGGVFEVGKGAFAVKPHIYEYDTIKPLEYYYPHEISEEILEKLIQDQVDGVEKSIKYLKALRDKYRDMNRD